MIKSTFSQIKDVKAPKEQTFCYAAFLHDIALEDDDLAKISSTYDSRFSLLNEEKRKIVREHPVRACVLVDKLKNKEPSLKEFILNHHEKPKGKGFPKGVDAEKLDHNVCYLILAHEIANYLLEETITLERLVKVINILKEDYSHGNFSKPLSYFEKYLVTLL